MRSPGEGKPTLLGSADPAFLGDPECSNPEEFLVVSLSECHMLTYLSVCARGGVRVTGYEDAATGTMEESAGRRWAVHRGGAASGGHRRGGGHGGAGPFGARRRAPNVLHRQLGELSRPSRRPRSRGGSRCSPSPPPTYIRYRSRSAVDGGAGAEAVDEVGVARKGRPRAIRLAPAVRRRSARPGRRRRGSGPPGAPGWPSGWWARSSRMV